VIPLQDCGTTPSGGFGRTVDNIIVIQTDDTVQVGGSSVTKIYRFLDSRTRYGWHIRWVYSSHNLTMMMMIQLPSEPNMNDKLQNLYISPNLNRVIKWRMRWANM
jgi:hypothetical protein